MFSFSKQPWEETSRAVDFASSAELVAGETIASATVFVSMLLDPTQTPLPSLLVSSDIDGTLVRFRVAGGVSGENYRITVRIITNAGHRREVDVLLFVQEY